MSAEPPKMLVEPPEKSSIWRRGPQITGSRGLSTYPRCVPLDSTTLSWMTVGALGLSVLSLLIAIVAWRKSVRRSGSSRGKAKAMSARPRLKRSPMSTDQVTAELHSLRQDVSTSLRHMAVVRYDAFGDMGGHLSWSMALLDDGGDGVVVTSIHGRSDARTYAKNVAGWSANQQLSPEEEEAINFARSDA
jgi:hypothetical protein